jgi:hypothetical protein
MLLAVSKAVSKRGVEMVMEIQGVILAIILGTLAGIVYCLRVLVLVERRIARIDFNIESLTKRILEEEIKIEAEERKIEKSEERLEGKIRSRPKKKSRK